MSTIITPEMVKAGATLLGRGGEASSAEALADLVYRTMAAIAPRDAQSQLIAELEERIRVADGLVQAQRERIEAADALLEELRERVADLQEHYLGIPPRPN